MKYLKWFFVVAFATISFNAAAVRGSGDPAVDCNGWVDVPITHVFCPSIEWITIRNITFGTTSSTFSPEQMTPRMQNAAFLSRLGKHVMPQAFNTEAGIEPFNGTSPGVCTVTVPGKDWPQLVQLAGVVTLERTDNGHSSATSGEESSSTKARFQFQYQAEPAYSPAVTPLPATGLGPVYYMPVIGKETSGTVIALKKLEAGEGVNHKFQIVINPNSGPVPSTSTGSGAIDGECSVTAIVNSQP